MALPSPHPGRAHEEDLAASLSACTPSTTLSELRSMASKGCIHAFARLYDATSPHVLSLVRTVVPEHQSEEVLAAVYIEAWREYQQKSAGTGSCLEDLQQVVWRVVRRKHAPQLGVEYNRGSE